MHFPIINCLVHRVLSNTKCLRNVTCSETSIICCLFWAVHSSCRWALDKKNKKHNQSFWAGSRKRTPPFHCQLGKCSQNPSLQPLLIWSLAPSHTVPQLWGVACCLSHGTWCAASTFPRGTEQYFLPKSSPFSFVVPSYLVTVETLNVASNQDPICFLIILPSAKVRVQIWLTSYHSTFCRAFCSFWMHTNNAALVLLWFCLVVSLTEITDSGGKKPKVNQVQNFKIMQNPIAFLRKSWWIQISTSVMQ